MKYKYIIFFAVILMIVQINAFGQAGESTRVIKGTVTSKTTGETLVGVTITEVNSENRVINGVITDLNGKYVIKIKNAANNLVFSYIGFKKQVMRIGNDEINVAMEEEGQELQVVNIVGKATQGDGTLTIPKREISGAIQKVSTMEFEGVQVTSIDDALQGRIAGLDIVSNSGDPGSGTTMKIRGASSINANTQPLIVINGIPFDAFIDPNFDFANSNQEQFANMLSVNVDDILDIVVLKDAASTAQWGSKGANGVLSITTKKGAMGKPTLSYTYRFTRNVQPRGRNLLNGDNYTMMIKQAVFNPFQYDFISEFPEYNYQTGFSEYRYYNNNTDWYKAVTQVGYTHDHSISASGGTERANYRISGGVLSQTGTIKGQKLSRVSSRSYLEYKVSDRLRFVSEFSFTYSDNDKSYYYDDNKASILDIAYNKMPNLGIYSYDINGNVTGYYNVLQTSNVSGGQRNLKNPVALALEATNNSRNYRLIPTFRIDYDILQSDKQKLVYQMYVSFDVDNTANLTELPSSTMNVGIGNAQLHRASNFDGLNLTVQTDNNLTWVPKFASENHSLIVYGSFQLRAGRSNPFAVVSSNFPSSEILDATSEGYLLDLKSTPSQWRSMAILGRAHYAFKSKYILDFTFRRDGSTKFGTDNKFGNFPGISAKWIISDEPFMKGVQKVVSMLAIRPSWGISGREPDRENLYQSRMSPYGQYMDIGGYVPSSIPLITLRWEKSMAYNIGMDLGFFNDKLVFDLNGYLTKNSDILFKDVPFSDLSGFSVLPWVNAGEMRNIGWEINGNGNKVIKFNNFTVDFLFNIANNKNTLIELSELLKNSFNQPYGYNNGEYLGRIQEGNAWGSIYGFRYKGVYQYNDYIPGVQESAPVARDAKGNVITDYFGKPVPMKFAYGIQGKEYTFKGGDAIYEDINHDGSIDNLDIVYLGNSNPKLNGGFGTTLRYKDLSVTAFFNFRVGNKIVDIARMNSENMYTDNNQSIAVNYRWRKDGDVTEMPRALFQYGYNWLGSDRYVEDGSFLRFKYLTVRYSAPKKFIQKLNMKSVSFYFTMNNISVFTKYTGIDPEVGYGGLGHNGMAFDESKTPRTKDFTLGVSLGF